VTEGCFILVAETILAFEGKPRFAVADFYGKKLASSCRNNNRDCLSIIKDFYKYADDLPIHAIAVVALGFERVVWERVL
jgi:hypothetical protein